MRCVTTSIKIINCCQDDDELLQLLCDDNDSSVAGKTRKKGKLLSTKAEIPSRVKSSQ